MQRRSALMFLVISIAAWLLLNRAVGYGLDLHGAAAYGSNPPTFAVLRHVSAVKARAVALLVVGGTFCAAAFHNRGAPGARRRMAIGVLLACIADGIVLGLALFSAVCIADVAGKPWGAGVTDPLATPVYQWGKWLAPLIGAFGGWFFFNAFFGAHSLRASPERGCANCGYDLEGLQSLRCPECGTSLREISWPKPQA